MRNLTLKEQLQALSLNVSAVATPEKNKKKLNKPTDKKTLPKPAWLEHAQYGVELLRAYFPDCFKELKEEVKPLKVGIKKDLVKVLSTRNDIVTGDKGCMVSSLAYYVGSIAYHKAIIIGAPRIDLNGQVAGTVTAEEAQYSKECLDAKLKKTRANVIKED